MTANIKYAKAYESVNFTLTGTVSSGDVIISGGIVGIAQEDGVSGDEISVVTRGAFTLTADGTTAFVAGDKAYWDVSSETIYNAAGSQSDRHLIGTVLEAKSSSATTCIVNLVPNANPEHTAEVIAADLFTTAGGDVNESITATGAVATDVAIVTINTVGATPVTVTSAICAADAINVVMSADPSTDHVLNYMVIRPKA